MATIRILARLVLVLSLCLPATAPAAGNNETTTRVLRVLTWPGYADADVVAEFERRHGVRVELTLVDTDTALWQKMSANHGGNFDIFAVNTAELQRYIAQKLVLPLDPGAIPNTRRQLPRFRELAAIPGLTHAGKAYGIPYTYAEMGLIYDRSQFARPPDSITALWDPSLRGRVLAYNGGSHNFSLVAQRLGKSSPYRLATGDWPRAVSELIALRRNVLGFYTSPAEATRLFRQHHVALLFANYGQQQVQELRAAGADIGYVVPREGALAWLDCWVIGSAAKDTGLAHAWINFMLEERISGLLVSRQGLASTLAPSPASGPDDRLLWLEPVEDIARREKLWARIISGDRAARVLAP